MAQDKKQLTIDEYKKVLVGILKRIDSICEENHLNYQLAYGTLLGAVRHGGFIPWDDDVDIIMPRADYVKLRDVIARENHGINFIDIETEPETIYPFGKICDTSTVLFEKNFRKVPGYGAYVDVFPLDYVPESGFKRKWIFRKYRMLVKLIQHSSRTNYTLSSSRWRNFAKAVAFRIGHCFNTWKLIIKVDNGLQRLCPENKTSMMSVPWDSEGHAFRKEDIYRVKKIGFEDAVLNVSENYDDILTKMYGDYMKLPPEEERVSPHNLECYYI